MEFITQHKDHPFFCYLPFNTPHSPMQVPDRFFEKFSHMDPKMRNRNPELESIPMTRAALAMCESIDWNVGRVLAKLDELKLAGPRSSYTSATTGRTVGAGTYRRRGKGRSEWASRPTLQCKVLPMCPD